MKVYTTLTIFLFASAISSPLAGFTEALHSQESPLTPKELSLVLLMPNLDRLIKSKNMVVAEVKSAKVHQTDVIAAALKHHIELGGEYRDAYVMTHNKATKDHFKHLSIALEHREESRKPLVLTGQKINNIKFNFKNLRDCVQESGLGLDIQHVEGGYEVKVDDYVAKFEEGDKLLKSFMMDICQAVEVSKLQSKDNKRNLYLMEIKNLSVMLKDKKFGVLAEKSVEKLTTVLKKNFEKVYGENMVSVTGVKYNAAEKTTEAESHRILEESEVKVEAGAPEIDNSKAEPIRKIFTFVWIFVIFFACVEIYRIEVYRDSLVYSAFITSKKAE